MHRWSWIFVALLCAWSPGIDFGFREGRESLPVDDAPGPERCTSCHQPQGKDWAESRHAASWTNDVFQAGYIVEPRKFCVNCHAPHPEQGAEIQRNQDWYESLGPGSTLPIPERHDEPSAKHGIHCSTCHWRDGEILSSKPVTGAPHPIRVEPALATAQLCKGCHEFPMPVFRHGDTVFTETMMQSTWSEWQSWEGASSKDCLDCHMPEGRHLWHGAHDLQRLQDAVVVKPVRGGFEVSVHGVGHRVPTGDLFRNLQLQIQGNGEWTTIARFGREFGPKETPEGLIKIETADTRLLPDETRFIPLDRRYTRWRLQYHYASPQDEALAWVGVDQLIVTVSEGRFR